MRSLSHLPTIFKYVIFIATVVLLATLYYSAGQLNITWSRSTTILQVPSSNRSIIRDLNVSLSTIALKITDIHMPEEIQTEKPKRRPNSERPETCNNCFPHSWTYLISNEAICDVTGGSHIDLFIIIFTSHNNMHKRNTIRKTWISPSKNNTSNIRYAFFFGRSKDSTLNAKVKNEAVIFNDILMASFIDTYGNLTYKTIMGLKYVNLFCDHVQFVMKTDDDMWVNLHGLQKMLQTSNDFLVNQVGGSCQERSASPIRNKHSKWYASILSYPASTYPGFCSGTGYIMRLNVARDIYNISKHVPFFHLEDVYIAICIRKLGYHLRSLKGFVIGHSRELCRFRSDDVITCHQVPPSQLMKIWNANCSTGI